MGSLARRLEDTKEVHCLSPTYGRGLRTLAAFMGGTASGFP